jgi:hypothetical protein
MEVRRMGALAGIAAMAALVIGAGPARAGGSPWEWDQFAYEPAETVTGSAAVWITSDNTGRPEDGPYHAYLLPAYYEWPEGKYDPARPEESVYLDEITLVPYEDGATHSTARLSFTMPDVEPGEYVVHHCNDPCTKTFGDIMSTGILVVESDAEERLIARIQKLETKLFDLRYEVKRFPHGNLRVSNVEQRVSDLTDRVEVLEAQVVRLSRKGADSETGALSYFAGGLLALAAAGAIARRRRHGYAETPRSFLSRSRFTTGLHRSSTDHDS